MTGDVQHDGNRCAVCGESVDGSPSIELVVYSVCDESGSGVILHPSDEDLDCCDSWSDVLPVDCVHLTCVSNFFEAAHAGLPMELRAIRARGQ